MLSEQTMPVPHPLKMRKSTAVCKKEEKSKMEGKKRLQYITGNNSENGWQSTSKEQIKSILYCIIAHSLELHWPYLLTTACTEHRAYHQKNQHPAGLPIKECILLLQAEPSSVYPLQARQWLAVGIEREDQFQSPA